MILGNAWLKSFGNMIMNFKAIKIESKLEGKKKTSTIMSSKEILPCNVTMLEKLCRNGA